MRLFERHRKLLLGGLLTLLLVSTSLALVSGRAMQRLDLVLYDQLLSFKQGTFSDSVVVVAVDDASLAELGRWPWSRRLHARLIDRLAAMGARVVALDILFPEPQRDDSGADEAFAQALNRYGRGVLVVAPAQETPDSPITELLPLPELAAAAAGLGHVDMELDVDGIARRFYLYGGLSNAPWPSMALAMLKAAGVAVDTSAKQAPQTRHRGDGWVRDGRLLIPFVGQGVRPATLSYADVLAGRVSPAVLRDKFVLVGATASGLGDALSTPASSRHERMPGVELNAHILNGLLTGELTHEIGRSGNLWLTALLVALSSLLFTRLPLRHGLYAVLALGAGMMVLSGVLLSYWSLWFSPLVALLCVLAGWLLWAAWEYGVEARLRQHLEAQLQHLASHNLVTGLPNQGVLAERVRDMAEGRQMSSGLAGFIVLHANWPGSASSILGRPMSDGILRAIAGRLEEACHADDFLAHLAGDDFALLAAWATNKDEVRARATAMLEAFRQPLDVEGESVVLLPRVGVSLWPADGHDAVTLLRNAYTAMFESRIDGTDQLAVYSAAIGRELQARSDVEQALARAMDRDEFKVHYQLQVDAETCRPVGVEALMRWDSAELGWVAPSVFIPVAEHTGLIGRLSSSLLEEACLQIKAWEAQGLGALRLGVNLSPLQFTQPDLVHAITDVLRRVQLPPSRLELEITESMVMRDIDMAVAAMKSISQQGMELAIDDFGTGYSSLSSLRQFPLDRIKVDQSFVREIPADSNATEIVLSIIDMAKRLRLKIIAEGVETEEQARLLREHGCDELQGYLYSRPLAAGDLELLLREGYAGPLS